MTVMQYKDNTGFDLFVVMGPRKDDMELDYDEAKELATKLEQAIQDYETTSNAENQALPR